MVALVSAIILAILCIWSHPIYAKIYGSQLCNSPEYTCYTVQKGDNWAKLFPDEQQRDLVMRVNRINIKLSKGMKIAIPNNLSADPLDFAPFLKQIDPTGKKMVYVSLAKLAFGAYDETGALQHWGPISGGQSYCRDIRRGCRTITGSFKMQQKGGSGCKSTRYPVGKGGAPMPFCMFFHGNYALHGSPIVPGYHASHGCVRMFVDDARWLNQDFTAGERSVPVVVRQ